MPFRFLSSSFHGATSANGESLNTALGRIGARAGYESPRFAVYAKANWYHDFGGNHVTVMSVDTDRLRVHEDYGDTWFSYGLGGAYKINDGLQAYFDLERGTVPTTMRNGARMWDCAGVSVPFAYICCG